MPAKPIVDLITQDSLLGKLSRGLAIRLMEKGSIERLNLFKRYIKGEKILDVGVGTGSMYKILDDKGFKVDGIDVSDTSLYPEIKARKYDGENFPYKSKTFDTGLLVCVLHHCGKQLRVLEETMRTCSRVIIIEDTFRNQFERKFVSARDMVGNFEFFDHEYRSSKDWLNIFKKRGWKTVYKKEWSSMTFYGMYGRQTLFVIEKEK